MITHTNKFINPYTINLLYGIIYNRYTLNNFKKTSTIEKYAYISILSCAIIAAL